MTRPNTRDGGATVAGLTVARPSRRLDAGDQGRRSRRDGRDGRDGRVRTFDSNPHPSTATTKREQRKGTTLTTRRPTNQLLTVAQAAERLGTTERFPRRLIAERRITFVKLGTHVRIPERALNDFIAASTIEATE